MKINNSTNYGDFKLIGNNRVVNRSHVEALKKAFAVHGNLTAAQPILVNEDMEIIDGQHRYTAAKELGEPVHYTQQRGLTVNDAISMNILHRNWTIEDYAKSYADSGNEHYKKYLELKEDYGFSNGTIVSYTNNYLQGFKTPVGQAPFRKGGYEITDEIATRDRLDKLVDIMSKLSQPDKNSAFATAVLAIMQSPEYDHTRMLSKLEVAGDRILRKFGTVEEYKRALEEVFNYHQQRRSRLY